MNSLSTKSCQPCEGAIPPLEPEKVQELLQQVNPHWQLNDTGSEISRSFDFKNYYQTMAFVNAIAWIANQEGHHPDMEVSYNRCLVRFSTHAIKGLSENDFICAAKVDGLLLAPSSEKPPA